MATAEDQGSRAVEGVEDGERAGVGQRQEKEEEGGRRDDALRRG